MNVKVNDNVVVLAGKDKGKQGKVISVSPKANRVTVEGVNIQHKHEKARNAQSASQIVTVEGPIDASNVMVVCDACGKATRIRHSEVTGKSVRVCAKCGAVLDKAYQKAAKSEGKAEQAPKKRVRKRTAATAENSAPSEENQDSPRDSKMAEKEYKNRVKQQYETEVMPYLMKKFGYKSVMQCPKLVKIVINTGLGDIKDNAKSIQMTENEIKMISGQQPILTKAKKSVANFKVREGQNIGVKVTLRGDRMYEFYDKFVSIALPRLRDFRGVSDKAFDGRGNYAVGIKEQLIFPEITYDQVEKIRGMDICIVTTANTDEEARELLKALGMPFKK